MELLNLTKDDIFKKKDIDDSNRIDFYETYSDAGIYNKEAYLQDRPIYNEFIKDYNIEPVNNNFNQMIHERKVRLEKEIAENYRSRRNVLCESLNRMGWDVTPPKATMMVWAEIPDKFKKMGSLEFSKMLLEKAKVAVAPGIGFGEGGDHFVRFSLVENEHRIRQAIRGIREVL